MSMGRTGMADSRRILTPYDEAMWESLERQRMQLPRCRRCGVFRYPPGPVCAACSSLDHDWCDLSGGGTILSWVRFHRQYFDDHPPPYNAIAVRLDEGPILVSNLIGREPEADWIGQRVTIAYRRHGDRTQHAFHVA